MTTYIIFAIASPSQPNILVSMLPLVFLIIVLYFLFRPQEKSSLPLVIKTWQANNQPVDNEGNYVVITGRQGGLIAWLLALMKIDPVTSIKVSPDRVEFASASLSGTDHRIIPILSVCSTYYGYLKPWKSDLGIFVLFLIFAGFMSTIIGGFAAFFILFLGLGASLVYYFLSRTLTLGIVEHSGLITGIKFKRSVIEGVEITPVQGAYICQLIQFLIESRRAKL